MERRKFLRMLSAGVASFTCPSLVRSSFLQNSFYGETPESLEWWRNARFGMFIHWGPVSLRGTEIGWSRGREVPVEVYDTLYQHFYPDQFDAVEWVGLAKAAGMKYIVLTSKHHDGFCLWDSQYTDYDIMSTPYKRDVMKELADECRRQDIRFCTYYSILDWYHPHYQPYSHGGPGRFLPPGQKPDFNTYVKYMKNQLKELIENYGPLDILWFDGEWEKSWTHADGKALYDYVKNLQQDIIINNRVDKGRQGMAGTTISDDYAGDYDTPEQEIGAFQVNRPWETCMTLGTQWAYKPDDSLKPFEEVLHTLIHVAGGDGNFLLNVGPNEKGLIEPGNVLRLREIGTWLRAYGRTIYGTRGGPFKPGKWGASTHKEENIFLFVEEWDDTGLILPSINQQIQTGSLLTGGTVNIYQDDHYIILTFLPADRQETVTVVELTVSGRADDIPPTEV